MSVKSVTLTCDWCEKTTTVEFDPGEEPLFFDDIAVDEDWWSLEGGGEEKSYCSKECLVSDL